MKVKKETVIRVCVWLVAMLNQFIVALDALPFASSDIYGWITVAVSVVTSAWTLWKNNSFTPEAIQADEYMRQLKEDG